ncbi:MAG: response regulator [Verrucomicrobiota bacterium]|nr:response regulator [Verrucomicrobiota bacterium]
MPGPAPRQRLLLLEDDPGFQEISMAFLEKNSFEVVPVVSGVEGVHQVLAGDFAVILCDMMMPRVPGDTFYRAVERMRPHLCNRFIFMTGYSDNLRINSFFDSVKGIVLHKPFPMEELLELTAFVQIRSMLEAA